MGRKTTSFWEKRVRPATGVRVSTDAEISLDTVKQSLVAIVGYNLFPEGAKTKDVLDQLIKGLNLDWDKVMELDCRSSSLIGLIQRAYNLLSQIQEERKAGKY